LGTGLMIMAGFIAIGSWLLVQAQPERTALNIVKPQVAAGVLHNPYIGFAPSAVGGPYPFEHRLVYKVLTWRELEPREGEFAFEQVEATYRFDQWADQGVKFILRVVLDYPTDTAHRDIPDWAYAKLRGDGIDYDEDVGRGFSPNYSSPILLQMHKRLIDALGARYDLDPRVAFIALGSLGHWGEWHTYNDSKITIPFPPLSVSDRYVQHYLDAFPNKKLLMRRPHPIAKEHGIGLYNDVFGTEGSTNDYVDWFENGYFSLLAGGVDMPSMPDFWKWAPSGGEFSSGSEVLSFLEDGEIDTIIEMAKRSHLSWIGPPPVSEDALTPKALANMDKLLIAMGYRLRIDKAVYPIEQVSGSSMQVDLSIANDGVAPFYYDWPFELTLVDSSGHEAAKSLTYNKVHAWQPGISREAVSVQLPKGAAPGDYRVLFAILDPETMRPSVDLAMEGRQPDGRYELGSMEIRKPTMQERIHSLFTF